jgi:2,3-bisphosphoglycerate-independent phosphoglycerate mutase
MNSPRKPVVLIIRDGWGKNPHPEQDAFNATVLAKKPCDDMLHARYPVALVKASGLDVGLPDGVMGNSEVGHENIGAGRIVNQELVRINKLFTDGLLGSNSVWRGVVGRVKGRSSKLHLMGIVSDAGVHGMLEHLYGILAQAKADGVAPDRVFIHAFTDGRDTPPTSGIGYVRQVDEKCRELGIGRIASVCGRFWAMDRDNRWDRVEKAYGLLTGPEDHRDGGERRGGRPGVLRQAADGHPDGRRVRGPDRRRRSGRQAARSISDGDAVVFYNYRGDRPREITKAFVLDDFKGFDRGPKLDLYYATMTEYETGLPVHVILPKPEKLKNILGEVVSSLGPRAVPLRRDREESPRHLFLQQLQEGPFPRGGTRVPAEPQGRDLRPPARDVRGRRDPGREGGDPFRKVRADRGQFRQSRHGGAHRLASGRGQGGRGDGPGSASS